MSLPKRISWINFAPSLQGNIAFLICLLLSVSVWLSIKLSQFYQVERTVKVSYSTPSSYIIHPSPIDNIIVQFKATGWNLLSQSLVKSTDSHLVIVPKAESGRQSVSATNLYNMVKGKNQFRSVVVSEIFPDLINFQMIKQDVKKVPITINTSFYPTSGHVLKKPYRLEPDSVTLQGPFDLIDSIYSWPTEKRKEVNVHDLWEDEMALKAMDGVMLSTQSVQLTIESEQLTQKSFIVSIKSEVEGYQIIPDHVEISFSIGLSYFESIDSSLFAFRVEYPNIIDSTYSVPVILSKQPENIINLQFSPKTVTFFPATSR